MWFLVVDNCSLHCGTTKEKYIWWWSPVISGQHCRFKNLEWVPIHKPLWIEMLYKAATTKQCLCGVSCLVDVLERLKQTMQRLQQCSVVVWENTRDAAEPSITALRVWCLLFGVIIPWNDLLPDLIHILSTFYLFHTLCNHSSTVPLTARNITVRKYSL